MDRQQHEERKALIRQRQKAARKAHAQAVHTCACGRVIKGNAYYTHAKACHPTNSTKEA